MEFITGVANKPHVTSMQHRAIYEMIIGKGSYILDKNELLEPELQSNNSLKIRSGMLAHHGGISEVKANTYDTVTIGNGSQGMKRVDLVVARYEKDPETSVETMEWKVIQGTPSEDTPVVPPHIVGNMQDGDLTDDCPAFQVHLDGIQVTEVKTLLPVLEGSLAELNSKLEEISANSNVLKIGNILIQYGFTSTASTNAVATIELIEPFANNRYYVSYSFVHNANLVTKSWLGDALANDKRTPQSFGIYVVRTTQSYSSYIAWFAIGIAAK